MKLDENQSSVCPSSSTVCSAPRPAVSRPIPSQSIGGTRAALSFFSSAGKNARHMNTAKMPIGMLMKKIQRQLMFVVR